MTCKKCNGSGKIQSPFIGLTEPIHKDIPIGSGSMGLGFGRAVGMARARKALGKEGVIYVLMSDGEMHCGNVWESAMKAMHEKLDNIVVIVDWNGLCAMGKTEEVLSLGNMDNSHLRNKWAAFGWTNRVVNGHDYSEIEQGIWGKGSRRRIVLARTVKGKGWKRAENNNLYHYKHVSDEEYEEALR